MHVIIGNRPNLILPSCALIMINIACIALNDNIRHYNTFENIPQWQMKLVRN